jgi:hypothetical protein
MEEERFNDLKRCPSCGQLFSLEELLWDPTLIPVGMASDEEDSPRTMYYFTHEVPGCGTTFTIPAEMFRSAIDESVPEESLRGHVDCPRRCTRISEFQLCPNNCYWSPYRKLLVDMAERRKSTGTRAR